jgi:hypothetical protein
MVYQSRSLMTLREFDQKDQRSVGGSTDGLPGPQPAREAYIATGSGMARRRRRRRRQRSNRKPSLLVQKFSDLAVMVVAALIAWVLWGPALWTWVWVLIYLSALGVWYLFFMPTYCDAVLRTNATRQCSTREVRGKLRGCGTHRRDKRDAVFSQLLHMRNPGMLFRFVWRAPGIDPLVGPLPPDSSAVVTREIWTLIFTILGTLAGVAGTIFAVAYR